MSFFDRFKKKNDPVPSTQPTAAKKENAPTMSNEEKYGKAWLLIVGQKQKDLGLQMMRELDKAGFVEGTIALSMFCENQAERKALVKKAADAGNPEGLWEYCGFLPHSYIPNPNNAADALWEKYCLEAAEKGSVDAMNEMGNIFNRRGNFAESMYWYAMANANDHPQGKMGMVGIARKWAQNGCPREFVKGSPKFDAARHKVAIAYLELNSDNELSSSPDDIIRLVLDGVPIAGYFAGDLFESIGNDEMAYKMYNALAFENDAHALKCYADMLFTGKGTQKDPQNAIRMYLQAAEAGDRTAMFIAGELTKASNKNMAAYWYGVSHSRGYEHSLQRMVQLA